MSLKGKEKEILETLAKKGFKTDYDLSEKERVAADSTVWKALKHLKKLGLVEVKRKEPFRKIKGREKKFYGLTLMGLAATFISGKLEGYMDQVAVNYGQLLPLLIGKWRHFGSAGLGKEFMKAVKWVSSQVLYWGVGGKEEPLITNLRFQTERWTMEQFYHYVFVLQTPSAKILWMKAFRADVELRTWAIQTMREWLAEQNIWMKIHERTLQLLEMPNEPEWDRVVSDLRWHPPPEYR